MTRSVLISFAGLTTGLAMSVAYAGGRIALLDLGLPTEATVFESELAVDHEIVRVPGVGSHAWVFWNGGEDRIEIERDGHKCAVSPKRVGYLQVADDGSLVRSVEL